MSNYQLELYHHGRLGQKWGKKNGPPYPLDYSKLSAEEISKDKERAINEGDVATANANRNYFSYNEIDQVIKRYDLNKRLASLQPSDIERGMKAVEKITGAIRTASNLVGATGDFAKNVNKLSKELSGNSNNGNSNKSKNKNNNKNNGQNGQNKKNKQTNNSGLSKSDKKALKKAEKAAEAAKREAKAMRKDAKKQAKAAKKEMYKIRKASKDSNAYNEKKIRETMIKKGFYF